VTNADRLRDVDDTRFFSIFEANPDGTPGRLLIGRDDSGNLVMETITIPLTPAGDPGRAFIAQFKPSVPAVAGGTDNLRAVDVVPSNFQSEVVLEGTDQRICLRAEVNRGVALINPDNGSVNNPVVAVCRSGDQLLVRYHIYDSDKSDVRSVTYEFLDSSGTILQVIDNVDLAGPLSQSSLVSGQSFTVEQAFTGGAEVATVRVTVAGTNSRVRLDAPKP
jgi:hypothetical protein